MGNRGAIRVRTPVLLLIALLFVACSGCIALEKDDYPGMVEQSWSGADQLPLGDMTSASPATENRNPVVPVDPVPVQPGEPLPNPNPHNVTPVPLTRVNATNTIVETMTVFEEEYSLTYSAIGLQVDVVDVPFIITFKVTPQNPEPDLYSRLVVTVRDRETLRLAADDGYNGIYGNDLEKSIKLYRPGHYIVTLDGRFVDVTVSMRTERTTGQPSVLE